MAGSRLLGQLDAIDGHFYSLAGQVRWSRDHEGRCHRAFTLPSWVISSVIWGAFQSPA
jgi:hypothetical protein